MKSYDWKFEFPASKVHIGAMAKLDFHRKRLEWWTKKKEETLQSIRDSGIEISQSIVEEMAKFSYTVAMSSANAARRGTTISINEELQHKFQEASSKVTEHQTKVNDYLHWVDLLDQAPKEQTLKLKFQDYVFFFGFQTQPQAT